MSKKCRLIFSKTGRAQYISHLDLMHTFQRAFVRAGIALRHSEGFNPHPIMSILLPLSVAQESVCEMLDCEILDDAQPFSTVAEILNRALPEGIYVTDVRTPERKVRELKWLSADCRFIYDGGVPSGAVQAINELFSRSSLIIPKKSKKGVADADIAPMILRAQAELSGGEVLLCAVVSAQSPSLNPSALGDAVKLLVPSFTPDFFTVMRTGIFTENMCVFR